MEERRRNLRIAAIVKCSQQCTAAARVVNSDLGATAYQHLGISLSSLLSTIIVLL